MEPSKRREYDLAASGDSESHDGAHKMPHYTQEELNEILRKIFAQSTFWSEGNMFDRRTPQSATNNSLVHGMG